MVLIGRDADLIAAALEGSGASAAPGRSRGQGVRSRRRGTECLSPACASWDTFRNYKHRAEVFIAAAMAWRPAMLSPAMKSTGTALPDYDYPLLWMVLFILSFGLVMVYSSSIAIAKADSHTRYRYTYFLVRHGVYLGPGVAAGFLHLHRYRFRHLAESGRLPVHDRPGLLVLVLIPVSPGSQRQPALVIPGGAVNLQPSELMKLFAVMLRTADYRPVRKAAFMDSFTKAFLPMLLVMLLVGGLLLREPTWRLRRDHRHRHVDACFLGGPQRQAGVRRPDRAAGHRLRDPDLEFPLPLAAHHRLHGPLADPRQGLPAVPRPHRLRPRRRWFGACVEKLLYLPESPAPTSSWR